MYQTLDYSLKLMVKKLINSLSHATSKHLLSRVKQEFQQTVLSYKEYDNPIFQSKKIKHYMIQFFFIVEDLMNELAGKIFYYLITLALVNC